MSLQHSFAGVFVNYMRSKGESNQTIWKLRVANITMLTFGGKDTLFENHSEISPPHFLGFIQIGSSVTVPVWQDWKGNDSGQED